MPERPAPSFSCPRCEKPVGLEEDSETLELYQHDLISAEDAVQRLMFTHYRHVHTEYKYELKKYPKRHDELKALQQRGAQKSSGEPL